MNINKLIHGPNVAGQSLVDRVMAAKHSLAGSGLAKSVCKATTEEVIPPKKKHVDYLVQCTNEPNVSVPQMAGLLLERTTNHSWVVVYKALLTSHSLMNYGNEKFVQYLASNNCSFNLENFTDKTSPQGYDLSPFVRRYARYLNEKANAYRLMAFDFCKIRKGKDDGVLRVMEADKLIKALPVLQGQVDKLLEFEVTRSDLNNIVVRASFMMLFKDLIRLLACYNDAIINLLAKFFEMNRKQCKEALDLYKKFVTRMEGVEKFFKVAESIGIDKGDIPDLAQAPSTLLDALEAHMKSLEGSKKGLKPGDSVASAISNLAAAAQSAGNAQAIDDNAENYFFDVADETTGTSSNNPFASSEETAAEPSEMTFDPLAEHDSAHLTFPCDDLLGLSDPFAAEDDEGVPSQANNPFLSAAADETEDPWANPGGTGHGESQVATSGPMAAATTPVGRAASPSMALFGLDMSKTSAMPRPVTPEIDFCTGLAKPMSETGHASPSHPVGASPINRQNKSSEKLIKGDLDSSLALLADNLTIQPSGHVKKTDHHWTGSDEKRLTGGSPGTAWSQQTTTSTTFSTTQCVQPTVVSADAMSPVRQPTPQPTAANQEVDLFGDLLGN